MTIGLSHDIWITADGKTITYDRILEVLDSILEKDDMIYVGTDSMLSSRYSIFVTAICIHLDHKKIADYFYRKSKLKDDIFKNIKERIMKEVCDSIEVGLDLMDRFPDNTVEIHADIGNSHRSATRSMVSVIKGWVLGAGFSFKLKPDSWASSSVADWHTKRLKNIKSGG